MSDGGRAPAEIRRILCHANPASRPCAEAGRALRAQLSSAGFQVLEGLVADGRPPPDLIVILGGDGFLMESLRLLGYPSVPVYGANFGSVGFLMNPKDGLKDLATTIRERRFIEEEHSVLAAALHLEDGTTASLFAFNDVVIERMTRQSLRVELYLDGVRFNHFAGDGFVLSTTAGSTAYNLAAGGPVVHPELQVLLITPLYPHRASPFHSMQFSLVVPLRCTVRIDASDLPKRGMRVVGDGEAIGGVKLLEVRDSARRVRLLRPVEHVFVKTLARKFIGE